MKTRTARQTGLPVTVARAEEIGVMPDDGEWATLCEEHGTLCHHATRKLAESWAAAPVSWCEECSEVSL